MTRLTLLACLLFIGAQRSSSTTISITITSGEAIVSSSVPATGVKDVSYVSSVGGIPTAVEIATIRSSWAMVKSASDVYVDVMLENLKAHPGVMKHMPKFAAIPFDQLRKNAAFSQRAYLCMHFALNFLINNLEKPSFIESAVNRVDGIGKCFVQTISPTMDVPETIKIFLSVLEKNIGQPLSDETKHAWRKGLGYIFSFVGSLDRLKSGNSALSVQELRLVRDSWPLISADLKVAESCLLKHFSLHPAVQKLYPILADVPISELKGNEEFKHQAELAMTVTKFILDQLDNKEYLAAFLGTVSIPAFYVDYMDAASQLDETTRLFLAAMDEELGDSISAETRAAWKKALDYAMAVMAKEAKFLPIQQGDKPSLSVKDKALVRESWALAKSSNEIAPAVFLKMFAANPDAIKLFPKIAKNSVGDLKDNKDLYNYAYSAFAGLNMIIKGIDDVKTVAILFKGSDNPSIFLDSRSASLNETKYFMEAMKEHLSLSAETESAWATVLSYVKDNFIKQAEVPTLEAGDKQRMRDNLNMVAQNADAGLTLLIKMFTYHPVVQSLFADIADVPLGELRTNSKAIAFGNMVMSGLGFMIDNIDNMKSVKPLVCGQNISKYFAPGTPVKQQLQETTPIVTEWVEEGMGGIFTPLSRKSWDRGMRVMSNLLLACV